MKKKRLLSVILSVVMILTMIPFGISASAAGGSMPFKDVKAGSWYYDSVQYVYDNGLMSGVGDERFDPDGNLTRAMFVTILGRMAGVETGSFPGRSFSDVQTGQWYSPYIEWAAYNDITSGIGEGRFGLNDYVTREQMAAFIARYLKAVGRTLPDDPDPVTGFKDINKVDSWALEGLEIMRKSGIIKGDENGNFKPLDSATRAQAAAIFERLHKALAPRELNSDIRPGDIVTFGYYEQDNVISNGTEPIEWVVLKNTSDGNAELISRYVLDCKPYNTTMENVSWEDCTLRDWLCNYFYYAAFNENEQKRIVPQNRTNRDTYNGRDANGIVELNNTGKGLVNITQKIDGGNSTNDRVYLLEIDDAADRLGGEKFCYIDTEGGKFAGYFGLKAACTDYAVYHGVKSDEYEITPEGYACCRWWLSSPGIHAGSYISTSSVYPNGVVNAYTINSTNVGVRPVITVKLDKVCTVRLEPNGGIMQHSSTLYVNEGGKVPDYINNKISKNGYVFAGWYTDKSLTQKYNFNNSVYSDMTLYAKWRTLETGDIIEFGSYEQDNNINNGKEPIEWDVLAVSNGRALLLSRYALDIQPYNKTAKDVTWAECSLRSWLNTTFIQNAFSYSEQEDLIEMGLTNPGSYWGYDSSSNFIGNNTGSGISTQFSAQGGKSTADKVFLLTIDEARDVFGYTKTDGLYKNLMLKYTDYSYYLATGERYTSGNKNVYGWWLRSPGGDNDYAAIVQNDGSILYRKVETAGVSVRPAVWIAI